MLKLILGLLLLLIPFLVVNRFEEGKRKKGFYIVLFLVLAGQFLIGFITQLFGVFNYLNVLIINLIVALVIIFKTDFKSLKENIKKIKIDWILVLLILIVSISLYSVHHDYTGVITTINNPFNDVKNFKYVYPYFSDEWVGVSLIDYSIESGKLPFVNSLWYNEKFANIGFGVYTFGSEMILLLGLNPLTNYIWLSFFNSLIICLLVYFILRESNLGRFSCFVASCGVLYITRGANLPGLWAFMPITAGISFLLFSILFLSLKENRLAILAGFFTLLFYPPLAVFLIPLFIAYYYFYDKKENKYLYYTLGIAFISAVFLIILLTYFLGNSISEVFGYLSNKFFYETFTPNAIPDFSIWKVISPLILVFSIIGIVKYFKSRTYLIIPIFIGLVYWILYSRVLWRFIIEYERNVLTTSILLILMAGFGIDYFLNFIKEKEFIKKYNLILVLKIIVILSLFFMSFFYTQLNSWHELKLHTADEKKISPAAPANAYLHEDDLKLFNFSEKRFITVPWKGLVIASASGNYPLHSKSSTLTQNIYDYYEFLSLNCTQMIRVSKKYKIDYVYTPLEINCTGFKEIGKSSEGFVLYEVNVSRK